jgi:hypothetical protein
MIMHQRESNMKNLITKKHKCLLYRDEIFDSFLLLLNMEVYRKSETQLGVYCWVKSVFLKLKKLGIVSNEFITDDKLYCFTTDNANLPLLIATGRHFKRIYQHGRWLKDKERRLAHKIIRFDPNFK